MSREPKKPKQNKGKKAKSAGGAAKVPEMQPHNAKKEALGPNTNR